jgi:hypothetical protein
VAGGADEEGGSDAGEFGLKLEAALVIEVRAVQTCPRHPSEEKMNFSPALLLAALLSGPVAADTPSFSVKQTGALFIEAPPGRDKNLLPMGTFGSQEKVEAHAIVAFGNRLIAELPTFGNDSNVKATAILPGKGQADLGPATTSSFRKVSEDGKKTLFSFSVARLPDSGVSGVVFSGSVKLMVATGIKKTSTAFQPKEGHRLDVGLGNLSVAKVESDSLIFSGDERLSAVAALRIVKPDGSVMNGERSAYSRQGGTEGTTVTLQWRFNAPISPGKIEFSIYQNLATLDVPVNLVVTKPY